MSIFDQTPIEKTIGDTLRDVGVSKNVWHNRPHSTQADLADFVVARVSGPIRPLTGNATLAECTVSITLFVRDVSNMKNSKRLSVMQSKVEQMPLEVENIVFKPFSLRVLGDSDDGFGYHFRIINIQAFIKKQ